MEKINIAELLKDCPKGMELDCALYEDVYFDNISDCGKFIYCYINYKDHKTSICFGKYGTTYAHLDKSKCVIFPKGKTTWEGFQRPFKDGDIITCTNSTCSFVSIFKQQLTSDAFRRYTCLILEDNGRFSPKEELSDFVNPRLATEEEKRKLFQAIKDNGYKWNSETKTLEKLTKFKVGDRVKHISAYASGIVIKVSDKGYYINYPKGEGVCYISFTLEKDYELAPNKFDINTLKAFESRVLVRDTDTDAWKGAFYSHYKSKKFYTIGSSYYYQCIPYEGHEHLLDTTNDCDNFYKTWEK